jgi:hypothetical protein
MSDPTPFGLSLSKPCVRHERFDKLSANGGGGLTATTSRLSTPHRSI